MYTKKGRKSNRSTSNKHIKFITKSLLSKKTPSPDNLNDENTKVINIQMFFRKERREHYSYHFMRPSIMGLVVSPRKLICCSPNPQYLRI